MSKIEKKRTKGKKFFFSREKKNNWLEEQQENASNDKVSELKAIFDSSNKNYVHVNTYLHKNHYKFTHENINTKYKHKAHLYNRVIWFMNGVNDMYLSRAPQSKLYTFRFDTHNFASCERWIETKQNDEEQKKNEGNNCKN